MSFVPYFDHISLGVASVEEAAKFIIQELGGSANIGGFGTGFRGCDWIFGNGGKLETIEPYGSASQFLHRFVEKRKGIGGGIHHINFKVKDIHAARKRAEQLGYTIVGFDDKSPVWKEFFLSPKEALGIVVQFAEMNLSEEDEKTAGSLDDGTWGKCFTFTPYVGKLSSPDLNTPANARRKNGQELHLSGLHLRVPSTHAHDAARLYTSLLNAHCELVTSRLSRYTWPTSSMYVMVHVDTPQPSLTGSSKAAEPEPLFIELSLMSSSTSSSYQTNKFVEASSSQWQPPKGQVHHLGARFVLSSDIKSRF